MRKHERILLLLMCIAVCLLISNNVYADSSGIFNTMAQRISLFAVGLRRLAYIISGFGIIMFTFLAIFGKISFRHLGYIFLSLFMLSATNAMIGYITGQRGELVYGMTDTYVNAVPDRPRNNSVVTDSGPNSSF